MTDNLNDNPTRPIPSGPIDVDSFAGSLPGRWRAWNQNWASASSGYGDVECQKADLVLAGGLTAENVGSAIRAVGPAAVDTASGVESTPGHKDPALVEAFVREARQAFAGQ